MQVSCGLIYLIRSFAVRCLFFPLLSSAQDTVSLNAVEINAKKSGLSHIGKKTETIDSTIKEQFKFNSVGDVLGSNTPVFVKSYGPGGLATTAFRGGNAEQTAVLWNGFNLQNMMLGQADLALMPSVLFDEIAIEYGGSSSLWGSGAVGGSIHLNNKTSFGKGLRTSTNLGAGSFGMLNGSLGILMSKKRFVSSTKVYVNSADNTFKYTDTLDKEHPNKRQKNANYQFKGLLQELKFILNQKQILSLNAWANSNQRRLPAFNTFAESKTYQSDEALRLTADWSYIKTNFRSVIRAASFNDNIDYTDSLRNIFSKSRTRSLMAENENYLNWGSHHQLNFGISALSSMASASNYEGNKSISRLSVMAGNKFSFLEERLITYVSLRAEYFSAGNLPVTGNVSLEYKINKYLKGLANAAKVYRQPTLNELYWMPGGNPNLRAEQGYTYEGSLEYKRQLNKFSVMISASAFSRKTDNWILWLPGAGGNPTPVNIQQVWSRGTETNWKINYKKNKFSAGVGFSTSYVLSTVLSNVQENSGTEGRQLIYTPRYQANGNLVFAYDKVTVVFFHQYTGYRFTSSDNARWLDPYHVSSLRCNYKVNAKQLNLSFFAACNNLFNTDYRILAGRPMPLRNYELGVTLNTF